MADLDRIADHCFSAAVPLGQAKRKGGVYFLMRHGRIAYVTHSLQALSLAALASQLGMFTHPAAPGEVKQETK